MILETETMPLGIKLSFPGKVYPGGGLGKSVNLEVATASNMTFRILNVNINKLLDSLFFILSIPNVK